MFRKYTIKLITHPKTTDMKKGRYNPQCKPFSCRLFVISLWVLFRGLTFLYSDLQFAKQSPCRSFI